MGLFKRSLLVTMVAALAAAPAASAGNLTWGAFAGVQRVDPVKADANTLACPTLDLCVVGLDEGQLGVSVNPTATPPTWSVFSLPVTPHSGGFSTDFQQVRCTSATACVAVSDMGDVYVSNDPATKASWTQSSLGSGQFYVRELDQLSCPSFCLGVDDGNGDVLHAAGPLVAGGQYTAGKAPIYGDVSCQSSGACVAPDHFKGIWHSSEPVGGLDKWTKTDNIGIDYGGSGYDRMVSVWCAPTFCLAGAEGAIGHKGGLYWTTNPLSSSATDWTAVPELISEIDGLTCSPGGQRCAAWRDDAAFVFDSASPTGSASTWAGKNVTPTDYVAEVSCPTVSTCFAVSLSSDFNKGIDATTPDPTATPAPATPTPTPTGSPTPGPTFVAPTATPTATPIGSTDCSFCGPRASDPPKTFKGSTVDINVYSPFDANVTVRLVAGQPTHIDGFFRRVAIVAKLVTYGTGKAALKAGATKRDKVKLTRKARKFFKKHAKAKVTFLVTAVPTAGGSAKTTAVKAIIRKKK